MKVITLFLLRAYKVVISPILTLLFGRACRFTPTCSQYAHDAIKKHGILTGSVLSLKRILKCSSFTKPGFDPVP